MLRAASLLDSSALREVAIEYLAEYRMDVLKSKEWRQFTASHRAVASEVLLELTKKELPTSDDDDDTDEASPRKKRKMLTADEEEDAEKILD